jgi:hypothetical protein
MIGIFDFHTSSPFQIYNVVIALSLFITMVTIHSGQEKYGVLNNALNKLDFWDRNSSNLTSRWGNSPHIKALDLIRLNESESNMENNSKYDLEVSVKIRFVLFLCDATYFPGAVALLGSLSESMSSTKLPPLAMIVGENP